MTVVPNPERRPDPTPPPETQPSEFRVLRGSPRPEGLIIVTLNPTELSEEDLSDAAKIYQAGFQAPPWNETWDIEDAKAVILKAGDGPKRLTIAWANGKIAGLIIGMPLSEFSDNREILEMSNSSNPYYLSDLVVDRTLLRSGIGRQLREAEVEYARQKGFTGAMSRTRVDNAAMIRLAESMGFSVVGTYTANTGGKPSPRVVLERVFDTAQ